MGSSHLGVFFHSKGTQTRERRVSQTAFWCRQTLGHLEEIPGLPRTPNLRVSPWHPLPPCCAAARPPPPAGVALGARPAPFRRGLRPRPRLAGFAGLRQAPPSLSSRSRRQSLEKWNLAAAAPCAGLAEPHWACSVARDSAALSRKLACCSPQLIRVLSGLRDLEAGSGADRTPRSAGEPRFFHCLQSGDPRDGPECAAGAGQPASLAACALAAAARFLAVTAGRPAAAPAAAAAVASAAGVRCGVPLAPRPRRRAGALATGSPRHSLYSLTPSRSWGSAGPGEDTGSQGCARAETAEGKVRVCAGDR